MDVMEALEKEQETSGATDAEHLALENDQLLAELDQHAVRHSTCVMPRVEAGMLSRPQCSDCLSRSIWPPNRPASVAVTSMTSPAYPPLPLSHVQTEQALAHELEAQHLAQVAATIITGETFTEKKSAPRPLSRSPLARPWGDSYDSALSSTSAEERRRSPIDPVAAVSTVQCCTVLYCTGQRGGAISPRPEI